MRQLVIEFKKMCPEFNVEVELVTTHRDTEAIHCDFLFIDECDTLARQPLSTARGRQVSYNLAKWMRRSSTESSIYYLVIGRFAWVVYRLMQQSEVRI